MKRPEGDADPVEGVEWSGSGEEEEGRRGRAVFTLPGGAKALNTLTIPVRTREAVDDLGIN